MRTTQYDMDGPEMKALNILKDEEYINKAQVYEEPTRMRTVIRGTFGKFDTEMKFEASFDDQEYLSPRYKSENYDDLIIRDMVDRVRSCVYSECEKKVGELKDVPLEISEAGGYKLTCYVCGNEAKIPTKSLRYYNVSREDAFMACLARLHERPPDPWMDCRNIYIP